jgi:hypothetical protein
MAEDMDGAFKCKTAARRQYAGGSGRWKLQDVDYVLFYESEK